MVTPKQFWNIFRQNRYGYQALFTHKDYIENLSPVQGDLNIFLPVRDRMSFAEPCIAHLRRAAEKARAQVVITFIENADSPRYIDFTKKHRIGYIYIPTELSMSNGLFAKALCYNCAFLRTRQTTWNVFHDLDVLVDENFFKNLILYMTNDTSWLQPYQKQRVMRLTAAATLDIIEHPARKVNLAFPDIASPGPSGSPGGTIVVRSRDVSAVGGYDPELFCGYAPEDAFFWTKLELLYGKFPRKEEDLFLGGATYANSPPIDVYHMEHCLTAGTNPYYRSMLNLLHAFRTFHSEEQKKVLVTKCRVLEMAAN